MPSRVALFTAVLSHRKEEEHVGARLDLNGTCYFHSYLQGRKIPAGPAALAQLYPLAQEGTWFRWAVPIPAPTWRALIFFFFFFGRTACGILVPRPGIEPAPPAVEAQSLNRWTTREFPALILMGVPQPCRSIVLLVSSRISLFLIY